MSVNDLIFEIGSEELPPMRMLPLVHSLRDSLQQQLSEAAISFDAIDCFAAPRRIAVLVKGLASQQPSQSQRRMGPYQSQALDENGQPSRALQGFAKSCQAEVADLLLVDDKKGQRYAFDVTSPGESVQQFVPKMLSNAIAKLPHLKTMRWGAHKHEFVRPVHNILLCYGREVIDCELLGQKANNKTFGHLFMAPSAITINEPADYADALFQQGKVIADFTKRRELITQQIGELLQGSSDHALLDDALLDEVTAIVEWPVALIATFDKAFLQVPSEALIAAMQDHQKCFPVVNQKGELQARFVAVSNIASKAPEQVIHGNERVMRARLADAKFFYSTDCQRGFNSFLAALKNVAFQAKLGTMADKAQRIAEFSRVLADKLGADVDDAYQAGLYAKADLSSDMVGEFPELQGIMGSYYAKHDGMADAIAVAIKEHYLPKFSGDELPKTTLGQIVALADRLDNLIGIFAIGQSPTGVKDPYALRRAALSVVRILTEAELALNLDELLQIAASNYPQELQSEELLVEVKQFILERLKRWYLEQSLTVDVINAVLQRQSAELADCAKRIQAVQQFRQLPAAESLAAANKRVSKLLEKANASDELIQFQPQLFELSAEKNLAAAIDEKKSQVMPLFAAKQYQQALAELASLKTPVDEFFDEVMVMVDDEQLRQNRLALLANLRNLFLDVADISLLQV